MVMCVCVWALDPVVFVTSPPIAKWLVIIGCISQVAWGTRGLDSIKLLVVDGSVQCSGH
jgi:hypothetical protein